LQKFCNEVHVCNLLLHHGVGVVPLVGVYSTEEHPLGLVYEYMDNMDIRQYLQSEPNVERLKLVSTPCAPLYINALTFFDNS
jgi:serine/threonine protein kinase